MCLLPPFLPRRSEGGARRAIATPWLGRLTTRWAGSIVAASVVATVALGAAATRLKLDTGIERLQARTQGAVLEQEIADRFSLPRDVLLAMGEDSDLQVLLEIDARLTQNARRSRAAGHRRQHRPSCCQRRASRTASQR